MIDATPEAAVAQRISTIVASWRGTSLAAIRASFEAFLEASAAPPLATFALGDMRAAWISAPGANAERTILYFHGGGFQIGSMRSHADLMQRLSACAGARVLGFDYRLAPEHRFPTANDDAFEAYDWLLDQGVAPASIAFAGDSAGAQLALATAIRSRDAGRALPACLALMSPWVDLTLRGESYSSRKHLDIFSSPEQLRAMARTYLGRDGDAASPSASPIDASLAGLPPLFIHGGDFDITLDDACLLHERARAQGVASHLRIFPRMYHHFQMFPELPAATESLRAIGAFMADQLSA